eukprot:IDg9144t1
MTVVGGGLLRYRGTHSRLLIAFLLFYAFSMLMYFFSVRHVIRIIHAAVSESFSQEHEQPWYVSLTATGETRRQQRILCSYRAKAARTIMAHMHIQKSGGTAFALALKSECICNEKKNGRPQKEYCRICPHVLEDESLSPTTLTQNMWTARNESFYPPYAQNCVRYNASSRWFGFKKRNRTQLVYSLNRLTTGWPCGVHVGYARLRMCAHRLALRGVAHVVVTLFREPVARYVSEFYQSTYNRIAIDSWDWCANPETPIAFEDYLRFDVSYPFQSRITKLLSGSPVQTGAAGADWNDATIRKTALKRALGVLHSTEDFLFGLAERLDETLEMFTFAFRRSFLAPSPCHAHLSSVGSNCRRVSIGLHDSSGRTIELTEQQMSDFKTNNWEDLVLYEEAKRIFDIRMEALRELQSLGNDLIVDDKCQELLAEPE